jgi:hypothetical protein
VPAHPGLNPGRIAAENALHSAGGNRSGDRVDEPATPYMTGQDLAGVGSASACSGEVDTGSPIKNMRH